MDVLEKITYIAIGAAAVYLPWILSSKLSSDVEETLDVNLQSNTTFFKIGDPVRDKTSNLTWVVDRISGDEVVLYRTVGSHNYERIQIKAHLIEKI